MELLNSLWTWATSGLQRTGGARSLGSAESILLVGQRGSGKSAALIRALWSLQRALWPAPVPAANSRWHPLLAHAPESAAAPLFCVHVDGLAIHDDAAAVAHISSQLAGLFARRGSAAPDHTPLSPASTVPSTHGAYEHHMAFVLRCLQAAKSQGIPVLLVIDEFDAFARQTKQTLLYNLLDMTQSSSVHFAVVGCTTRVDVVSLLEKRLRSRFSHRQIVLPHASAAAWLQAAATWAAMPSSPAQLGCRPHASWAAVARKWNHAASAMLQPSTAAGQALLRSWGLGRSWGWLRATLAIALAQASTESAKVLQLRHVLDAVSMTSPVPASKMLATCTTLQALLLAVAAQCTDQAASGDDSAGVRFVDCWARIEKLKATALRVDSAWSREAAVRSWEELVANGYLRGSGHVEVLPSGAISGSGTAAGLAVMPAVLAVPSEEVLQLWANNIVHSTTDVRQWILDGAGMHT